MCASIQHSTDIRPHKCLPAPHKPPEDRENKHASHEHDTPVHGSGRRVVVDREEEEERGVAGVEDCYRVTRVAQAAELEGSVVDWFAAPAFENAEDYGNDLTSVSEGRTRKT